MSMNAAGILSVNGQTGPSVDISSTDDNLLSVFMSSTNVTFVSFAYTTPNTCVQTGAVLGVAGYVSPPQQNAWLILQSDIAPCVGVCCEYQYFSTNTCGTDFQGCSPLGWYVSRISPSVARLLFTFPPYPNSMWSLRIDVPIAFGLVDSVQLRTATAITFALSSDSCNSQVDYIFGTSTTTFNWANSNAVGTFFSGQVTLVTGEVVPSTQFTLCYLLSGPGDPVTPLGVAMVVSPSLVKVY